MRSERSEVLRSKIKNAPIDL